MNQQLQDFYSHLNEAVITTNDFAEGTRYRKREKVAQFAYCGLNPVYRSYLSFDLDYPGAGRKFEELHIPAPSIVTTNRANGHCHYLYRLITPVPDEEMLFVLLQVQDIAEESLKRITSGQWTAK